MAPRSLLVRCPRLTLLSVCFLVAAPDAAQAQCESAKLVAPAPYAGDAFGIGVALDGDTALVGAYRTDTGHWLFHGVAHVFTWDGADWSEQARLDNPGFGGFGFSVALDGDTAVVGGAESSDCVPHSGAGVAVYERTAGAWSLVQHLAPPAGSDTPIIGHAVDLSGDTIVVGAARSYHCESGLTTFAGAHAFERTTSGWVHRASLDAPGVFDDSFGTDVAVDGDTIVVGAPGSLFGSTPPSAHVFERGPAGWTASQHITGPEVGGSVVDISGDTLLVGGAAYGLHSRETLFYEHDGTQWTFLQALASASTLAVHGDTVVAGHAATDPASRIRILRRWNDRWHLRSLRPADGVANDGFGLSAVATDGVRVLVGATGASAGPVTRAGASYVYDLDIPRPYCTTTPNSTGAHATLRAVGCPSVVQDDLLLSATGLPAGVAMLVYGTAPAQVPFGSGTRCVGPTLLRTRVQDVANQRATWQLDYHAGNPAREILPDSTWYFQAWFRDGPAHVNTTDGLEITFLP